MSDYAQAQAREILEFLRERGDAAYLGEEVTQLEHALQSAQQAREAGAAPDLILAALLHDVGHLCALDDTDPPEDPASVDHEDLGAAFLDGYGFSSAVVEPVRRHVAAKRYLVTRDPRYRQRLSEASIHSLQAQGGPFSELEADDFEGQPYAREAVLLRRWDDAAKTPGAPTLPLDSYYDLLVRHLDQARIA